MFSPEYIPSDYHYTKTDPYFNDWNAARIIDHKCYFDMYLPHVKQPGISEQTTDDFGVKPMKQIIPQVVKNQIRQFNAQTKKLNRSRYLRAWADCSFCFLLLGCAPDDYYQFSFPGKTWKERNSFLTYRRNHWMIKKYNPREFEGLLHKDAFDTRFAAYVGRECCVLNREDGAALLRDFLKRHKKAFMKQKNNACGRGAFILTEEEFLSGNYPTFDFDDYVAEECIVQHHELARLNPYAVNSIRVLTFHGVILQAGLKVGVGSSVVDNVHAGSVYGNIDLETGKTNAAFRNIDRDSFTTHPTTGEPLVGFQVPHWDLVKAVVVKIAESLPEIPYIGWDVAVTETGVCIIEGNDEPGQDGEITGIYTAIRQIEKGQRKARKNR